MNKSIHLIDRNNSKDNCSFSKTEIIIKAEDTGEVLFKGRNKVVLPGGLTTAKSHFGSNLKAGSILMDTVLKKYSYDQYLDAKTVPDGGTEDSDGEIVRLFAVGSDGCDLSAIKAKTAKYKDYLKITENPGLVDGLIPFIAEDETTNSENKYFGKRTFTFDSKAKVHYLFKTIEGYSSNLITTNGVTCSETDLPLASNIDDLEFYVSVNLKISDKECRSLFNQVGSDVKRINSISLLTARKKVVNNVPYYYNIRPLTKLNFTNEFLVEGNKSLDITYNIYY